MDQFSLEEIKFDRKEAALQHVENQTPERLAIRERVQQNRLNKLPRTLDSQK